MCASRSWFAEITDLTGQALGFEFFCQDASLAHFHIGELDMALFELRLLLFFLPAALCLAFLAGCDSSRCGV